jgi:hypothetical protein
MTHYEADSYFEFVQRCVAQASSAANGDSPDLACIMLEIGPTIVGNIFELLKTIYYAHFLHFHFLQFMSRIPLPLTSSLELIQSFRI